MVQPLNHSLQSTQKMDHHLSVDAREFRPTGRPAPRAAAAAVPPHVSDSGGGATYSYNLLRSAVVGGQPAMLDAEGEGDEEDEWHPSSRDCPCCRCGCRRCTNLPRAPAAAPLTGAPRRARGGALLRSRP